MKIVVATGMTQGARDGDYNFCVEGELIWVQEPCDSGRRDPDDGCGCARGFAGAASHRATTTAHVVESDMTLDDLVLAFETSLQDGGWPAAWAETIAEDCVRLAAQFPCGAVIDRRLNFFSARPEHAL